LAKRQQTVAGGVDHKKLLGFVEELEVVAEDRRDLTERGREIMERAEAEGLDKKAVRDMVRERRMDENTREAFYMVREDYRKSLGMLADMPLGEAAMNAHDNRKRRPGRPRRGAEALSVARAHLAGDGEDEDELLEDAHT
jgi:uncharacterized protein (UPF0335 family)